MQKLSSKKLSNMIMHENTNEIQIKGINVKIAFIMFDNSELITKTSFSLHVNAAKSIGIEVVEAILPGTMNQEEFFQVIDSYNNDVSITGIMFLIPIPDQINMVEALNRISYTKEIEGLHPKNVQILFPTFLEHRPVDLLVPKAVDLLLGFHNIKYKNANIVVMLDYDFLIENPIANLVGKYGTSSLLPYEGTLRLVTTKTNDVKKYLLDADIVIVSSQQTEIIKSDWIKDGAVLMDFVPTQVGVKYDENLKRNVPILKGAVDVESFDKERNIRFFPSIGGIGPVMIAVLLQNAIKAAEFYNQNSKPVSIGEIKQLQKC
ncbi:tetrahydrofolate dehydrogenase/cyclohydrolase catalytic domain-containing protein [Clostridium gasigenes]|uniref:tetrahydrofolate dehydrogenase/cyclohydrolase catalytic domain-containing protein n=1 Tax=Clostridium gasigenes TaxID=94869 RepID=UPI001C0B78AB|nr:tetrahydrofolate dehydrogenase/cyclohydrolase catalytic domain-containing protein [Clostridium gasigenes]MBU3109291.1 hypothetical protein [Clostridium gasigenes]